MNSIHHNKGKTKLTSLSVKKQSDSLRKRYESGELESPFKGKHHSKETKEKLRKKRLEYLKNNKIKTAWYSKSQGHMSYGESILHEQFIKNNIYSKYDVINEFIIYPYSIDFAFVNEKVAVEFDGGCHYKNGKNRINHDIKRDLYLSDIGWRTYRIPYFELANFDISKLINFIGNKHDKKTTIDNLIKYKNYINQIDNKKIKLKKLKEFNKNNKINIKKHNLLMSDIDFTKFGWVKKAAIKLNIPGQHVKEWMEKYMIKFYNDNCFKKRY